MRRSRAPVLVDPRGRPLASAFDRRGGYDGGSHRGQLSRWRPQDAGPNLAMARDVDTLRARSRDSFRNNPTAAKIIQSSVSNMIATGIVAQWSFVAKGLCTRAQQDTARASFERWMRRCDADGGPGLNALQILGASTLVRDGEVLTRLRARRPGDGLRVPLQLQMLEADFLDTSKHADLEAGGQIRMGIEFDSIGRRRSYWLRDRHPGDEAFGSLQSRPVAADRVIHTFRRDRPGQLRGIPWLAPVLIRLHALEQAAQAQLTRQKIAAMFAGFVELAADLEDPLHDSNDPEVRYHPDDPAPALEPGTMQRLKPGEKISFAEPADVGGNYETFLRRQLLDVAAGVGLTYEQATGDLSGVNYSSIRAGLLEMRRWVEQVQYDVLIDQWCRPVGEAWLDHAVLYDDSVDLPGYWERREDYHAAFGWRPPGFEWVDPLKDTSAKVLALKHKLTSRKAILAEQGLDVEEVDAEIAADNERATKLGLSVDPDSDAIDATAARILEEDARAEREQSRRAG